MAKSEFETGLGGHSSHFHHFARERFLTFARQERKREKQEKRRRQKLPPSPEAERPFENTILLPENGRSKQFEDYLQKVLNERFKFLWQKAQKRYRRDLASTGDAR